MATSVVPTGLDFNLDNPAINRRATINSASGAGKDDCVSSQLYKDDLLHPRPKRLQILHPGIAHNGNHGRPAAQLLRHP